MKFNTEVTQLMCVLQEALRPENQHFLPSIVQDTGLEKILDPELFKAVRYFDRRSLLAFLATLGHANGPHPEHFQRWLAATQFMTQQIALEQAVALCTGQRPAMARFYRDVLQALINPQQLPVKVQWTDCPCKDEDLRFATDILLDHRAVGWLPMVLHRWRQLDQTDEPWLWMCKTVAERVEYAQNAEKALALASALGMLLQKAKRSHPSLVDLLAPHQVDLLLRAGLTDDALAIAQSLHARKANMSHDYWLMRSHASRSEFEPAMAHARSLLDGIIDKSIKDTVTPTRPVDGSSSASSKKKRRFDVDTASQSLVTVNRLLRERGLQPFLMSGTLLGYVREGQLLSHDKDIDLGLVGWEQQYALAQALLSAGHYQLSYRGLRGSQTFLIDAVDLKHGMVIDFFFFHPRDDHFLHGIDYKYGFTQNLRFSRFGLKEVDFLGDRFWIPDNADQNLTENYGDWRTPQSSYVVTVESPALLEPTSAKHQFMVLIELMRSIDSNKSVRRVQRILDCCKRLGMNPLSEHLQARLSDWISHQTLH